MQMMMNGRFSIDSLLGGRVNVVEYFDRQVAAAAEKISAQGMTSSEAQRSLDSNSNSCEIWPVSLLVGCLGLVPVQVYVRRKWFRKEIVFSNLDVDEISDATTVTVPRRKEEMICSIPVIVFSPKSLTLSEVVAVVWSWLNVLKPPNRRYCSKVGLGTSYRTWRRLHCGLLSLQFDGDAAGQSTPLDLLRTVRSLTGFLFASDVHLETRFPILDGQGGTGVCGLFGSADFDRLVANPIPSSLTVLIPRPSWREILEKKKVSNFLTKIFRNQRIISHLFASVPFSNHLCSPELRFCMEGQCRNVFASAGYFRMNILKLMPRRAIICLLVLILSGVRLRYPWAIFRTLLRWNKELTRSLVFNLRGIGGVNLLHVCGVQGTTSSVHTDVKQMIIDLGVDPNEFNDRKQTPLVVASVAGSLEVVECLLDYCDFLKSDRQGRNAVHCICDVETLDDSHCEILKLLLARDESLATTEDLFGVQPIQLAENRGHSKLSRILVVHGASKQVLKDEKEESSLSIVEAFGNILDGLPQSIPLIRRFAERGLVDVEAPVPGMGILPLIWACRYGASSLIPLFLGEDGCVLQECASEAFMAVFRELDLHCGRKDLIVEQVSRIGDVLGVLLREFLALDPLPGLESLSVDKIVRLIVELSMDSTPELTAPKTPVALGVLHLICLKKNPSGSLLDLIQNLCFCDVRQDLGYGSLLQTIERTGNVELDVNVRSKWCSD